MPFVNRRPERFRLANYGNSVDQSKERWTLDTREDYEFLQALFASMDMERRAVGFADICAHLDQNPLLRQINAHVQPSVKVGALRFHHRLNRHVAQDMRGND